MLVSTESERSWILSDFGGVENKVEEEVEEEDGSEREEEDDEEEELVFVLERSRGELKDFVFPVLTAARTFSISETDCDRIKCERD